MLSEGKIIILNRMKINSPKLYEKALEKLNLSDSDIPVRNVPDEQVWIRPKQQSNERKTYYLNGRPYFGIPPVYNYRQGITDTVETKIKNTSQRTDKIATGRNKKASGKKKNTALFIDGENISHKKEVDIIRYTHEQGTVDQANEKVYILQKDPSTAAWSASSELNIIRLFGAPEKDKVDKKMQRDMIHFLRNQPNVDIFCIATSDGGFADTIKELRQHGKRVVLICEEKAPVKLRKAASDTIVI
ncbi:NYN domain-containing protein [Oribacterium sp. NK2B42]|uniref:NYN domain-containing protein n=1 Tax=Oribacterium sp. NK2B42 TaxID=689781 RepID=UPI000410E51D|nr:NYN domain-containing protein [Oribacterium sp. NK2B42]